MLLVQNTNIKLNILRAKWSSSCYSCPKLNDRYISNNTYHGPFNFYFRLHFEKNSFSLRLRRKVYDIPPVRCVNHWMCIRKYIAELRKRSFREKSEPNIWKQCIFGSLYIWESSLLGTNVTKEIWDISFRSILKLSGTS